MHYLRFIFTVTAFVFAVTVSFAGTISGVITDQTDGKPVPGATVTLLKLDKSVAANFDGRYEFLNIGAGTYQLEIKSVGYQTKTQTVIVGQNQQLVLNIALNAVASSLNEVVVNARRSTESESSARSTERRLDMVVNVLPAQTIQLLPDITVANVLQRVSGVSIERSSTGDGQYAIIRGMDKRYNYTLVNGVKIPSPDSKNRYIPLDIFPADLVGRIEVIKTLTPSLEGDAIGGGLNIVMREAPNQFLLSAELSTGYSQLFSGRAFDKFDRSGINDKNPQQINGPAYVATGSDFSNKSMIAQPLRTPINTFAAFTIGNRFLNQKLGAIVGLSYQNSYRGSNSDFFLPAIQPSPNPAPNTPVFTEIQKRRYSTHQIRTGINAQFDYKLAAGHQLSLFSTYVQLNDYQFRNMIDTSLSLSRFGPGTGVIQELNRAVQQTQSIINETLKGEHTLNKKLRLDWNGIYSLAKNSVPDRAELLTARGAVLDSTGKQVVSATNAVSIQRFWQKNSDRDLSGNVNMNVLLGNGKITFGGLYRHKTRENDYHFYILQPHTVQPFTGVLNQQFDVVEGNSNPYLNGNIYQATENIAAGYIQAKWLLKDKLEIIGGARLENTDQSYNTNLPATSDSRAGTISYRDLLPSVNIKYALQKDQNIRLAYFRSISRPGFSELVPSEIIGDYYTEKGNPYLKHTTADNFDLRYELYSNSLNQLLIGAFYKNIQNPIQLGLVRAGTLIQFLEPTNAGKATNFGAEVVFTRYMGSFGVSANYTYTHSSVTNNKTLLTPSGPQVVTETGPLQGQSANVANLAFLYRNGKKGLNAQVSLVYTGKRIARILPYYGLDQWQRGVVLVDLSAEKKLVNHLVLFLKATNLLNSGFKVDILQPNIFRTGVNQIPLQDSNNRILVQSDTFGQIYQLGLRYKL